MVNNDKLKDFRRELGLAIRRKRHKLNLSQEKFADIAQIHRTYVSSIELGKVDIGISVVYKISLALKTPLNVLIKSVEKEL